MEKQMMDYLTEILNDNSVECEDGFLDRYYELSERKKYLGKDFKHIYQDMKNVYSVDKHFFNYDENMKQIYTKLINCVINIKDNKIRLKLIPLIIYLDIDNLFYNYLYEKNYFNSFIEAKDFFIGTLSSSGVNIDTSKAHKHDWESDLFKEYQDGLVNNDFTKIYNFIEGIQRGRGFRYDPFIGFLSFVSVKIFFEDFIKLLNDKSDTLDVKYAIDNLNSNDKLLLGSKTQNILVKFEVIKEFVYFKSNNHTCKNILEEENRLLTSIISALSKNMLIWENFLKFYLEYPSRTPQLFLPLACVLSSSDEKIVDKFIDKLKISRFVDDDSKKALNNSVFKIENDHIQEYILRNIFKKWIDFVDNCDDYFGSIFLSDVVDIIIVYIQEFLSEDEIKYEIKQSIVNIQEIDNRWFSTRLEQNNYFYKQLSKLFVFGFAIEKYNLIELKIKLEDIINIDKRLKKEHLYKEKSTIILFEEYIF